MGRPKEFIEVQEEHEVPLCPHHQYCHGDCSECKADDLDAAKAILERSS